MSRVQKVAEELKREISLIVHDELKDPRLGFVTITDVEITRDLRFAKIYFSVLGKDEEHLQTKQALDSASGFIRRLIAQRIPLRFVPEIMFKEDRSSEYSIRIEEVLNEIKQAEQSRLSPNGQKPRPRKERQSEPRKISRKHKKKK